MEEPKHISHLKQNESGQWIFQSNEEHCEGVAALASAFAGEFGMYSWGKLIGLLHDRGKESKGFQAHIKKGSGFDNSARSSESHYHSIAGAILAHKNPLDGLYFLSNPIAGHHRGLYNLDELELKLTEDFHESVSRQTPDVKLEIPSKPFKEKDVSHIERMLFSCLVDADWLDTEKFMSPNASSLRGNHDTMETLKARLDAYCKRFSSTPKSKINSIRAEIQTLCKDCAGGEPGFYSLTVPTGGGKTIASVVWAINHAIAHGKKRIIIAIPFTSIIIQTAQILKDIFGEKNIIEHHSAVTDPDGETNLSLKLACENWDAPIVVTTNVQLFESMFSNKPSHCRKLHSICNSVIILDEVQTLPLNFYSPIVNAMQCYKDYFGVSFLLCTASQPVLDGTHKGAGTASFNGIPSGEVRPIIPEEKELHDALRRVDLKIDTRPVSPEAIADKVASCDRALCIVNTRRHALEVYRALPDDGAANIHLSRMMCPAHILECLNEIKFLLKDSERRIHVIATQLIEAGVDIDFPTVFRQLAGLDSLLQAAGRCNREGRMGIGTTHIFQFEKEKPRGSIGFATDAMKSLLSTAPDNDWFAPSTMTEFYKRLFANTPSFDSKGIGSLSGAKNCQYEEVAEKFRLIDDNGVNVIVNYGEAPALIEKLKKFGPSKQLSRQLGRYCVTVNRSQFQDLVNARLVEQPYEGFYSIPLKEQYDSQVGLTFENHFIDEIYII